LVSPYSDDAQTLLESTAPAEESGELLKFFRSQGSAD